MNERLELPASLAGERVDRVLSIVLECSRSDAANLIALGRVQLSGQVVSRGHHKVTAGEWLEVELLEAEPAPPAPSSLEIDFGVVYVDEEIIVIDKPAGLVVHPGAGHEEDTLVAGVLAHFPDLRDGELRGLGSPGRPGIVHRLDKDTSGLLVVARSPEAFSSLGAQLRSREMNRGYIALCRGLVSGDEGVIEAPIARSLEDPRKMAVSVGGREARTRYQVSSRYRAQVELSLLEVHLDTGRTHQIRVHLAAIGHPVLGDTRYGGGGTGIKLSRPFLHASSLELVHPTTGEQMSFSSPLPADLAEVLSGLAGFLVTV